MGRDSDTFFAHLLAQLYVCTNYDHVIICGDFNTIENIDSNFLPNRKTTDTVKSGHWETFLEFVKDSKTCIVNARITPQYDNYTCVSTKGRSVVDYILTTHDNINNITKCQVELTTDLIDSFNSMTLIGTNCRAPDHSMITMELLYSSTTEPVLCENIDQGVMSHDSDNSLPKRYNVKHINDTQEFMNSNDWSNKTEILINQFNNIQESQSYIDTLYGQLLLAVTGEMDNHLPNFENSNLRKRYKHTKPYWNNYLSNLWNEMRVAEKLYIKYKGNRYTKTQLHETFIHKRREFDKHLRKY